MTVRRSGVAALVAGLCLAAPAGAQELGGYSYVALSGQPHDVVYDPSRAVAYVSNRSRSEIDVVRLSDLAVLAPIPVSSPGYGMSLTASGSQLVVAFHGQDQVGVVDLASGQQVSTFDVPQPHPTHHPLRVDRDSEGRMYWQSGSTGGPFGGIYEFDPDTGASTPVFTALGGVDMNSTHDRRKWLLQIGYDQVAVWDAATEGMTGPAGVPGFGSGWTTWIAQGALSADCNTIVLSKSVPEITILDGSLAVTGTLDVGMSWGVLGDWADLAVMVELEYGEAPSNRISIMDTADIAVVDTLVMPEQIGLAEFNGGSKPIELMPDGDTLLAVGQTGLFLIDTSGVPEPATLGLLALGGFVLLRRRRARQIMILAAAAWVLAAAPAYADYEDLVLSLDPVAYWRLNDPSSGEGAVAADSSVSGLHDGLYHNGVILTTADLPGPGSGGQAASFDGLDDWISSISDAGFPAGDADRTFAMWLKYPAGHAGQTGRIFGHGIDAHAQHFHVGVYNSNDIYTPNGAVGVSRYGESIGFDPTVDGGWHFYAVTVNDINYRLYLDGDFVREKPMTTNTSLAGEAAISHPDYTLLGSLDEVSLFDMALTDQQVRDLYEEMFVPEPGALALLAMGAVALTRRRRLRRGRRGVRPSKG